MAARRRGERRRKTKRLVNARMKADGFEAKDTFAGLTPQKTAEEHWAWIHELERRGVHIR